jgi:site-specific DNA-methyltransferase (adenine-specific)/modification methylase
MAQAGRPRLHATATDRTRAYRARKRRAAVAPHVLWRQIGLCTLYCSDWQTVYALLPRHAAVVTDPPYDADYDYTKARRRPAQWDRNFMGMDQAFDPTPWLGFPEVILFGANHYRQHLPRWGSWWCWDKIPEQQPADFASDEWIWLSLDVPPYHYRHLWRGGMRAGEENWVHLPQKLHPAQKPLALLTSLVEQTAALVVIDPFMGSATTLAACVRLGRPCIGIELDPDYFAVACHRLQHEVEATRAQPAQAEAAD